MVSAVGGSDTSAAAGSDTSAVLGFATSALPPATRLSVIFAGLSSSIGSTGRYSFIPSADVFSFGVRSSSAPPSMVTMLDVRGCATAHSSQGVHTGGTVTAGVSAGNLVTEASTSAALQGDANDCA